MNSVKYDNLKLPKEIWYACYGSNIREERFMCYINGGTPPGAFMNFEGCSDKTKPKASGKFIIDHEVYFAKRSVTWGGGGICFLKSEKNEQAKTLGRRYLINESQFRDLVRQELKFKGSIEIDFEELFKKGRYDCHTDGRYGLLLYLGDIDGKPVITFTSELFLEDEINPPSAAYLKTIYLGLKEIYDLDDSEIFNYFRTKIGVKNYLQDSEVQNIISA